MADKYYDGALRLYNRARIVFVGFNDSDGYPNIKAVLAADKKPGIKEIVIKTNTSSWHVAQFREDPRGCLYFFSLVGFKGTMLKGTYAVVEDAKIRGIL